MVPQSVRRFKPLINFAFVAVMVLLSPLIVRADNTPGPLVCTALVTVPPQLRAEGLKELIGDIVITTVGSNSLSRTGGNSAAINGTVGGYAVNLTLCSGFDPNGLFVVTTITGTMGCFNPAGCEPFSVTGTTNAITNNFNDLFGGVMQGAFFPNGGKFDFDVVGSMFCGSQGGVTTDALLQIDEPSEERVSTPLDHFNCQGNQSAAMGITLYQGNSVPFGAEVVLGSGSLELVVEPSQSVPEPTALLLVGSGLAFVYWKYRARQLSGTTSAVWSSKRVILPLFDDIC